MEGWLLDSPSHLEYTDSCSSYQLCDPRSTVERANCDAQSVHIHLWEGLILQALWCTMLPMVSSALCLLCLALLLSVLSPPLRVHGSLSLLVAWTLHSESLSKSQFTVSVHGFSHSTSMPVRFLSHLRRFSYRLRAWNSLFGVIMNAREVAMCSHQNNASLFVDSFLSPSWLSTDLKSP